MISDNASTYVAASKEIQHLTDSPYLQDIMYFLISFSLLGAPSVMDLPQF
jgi:hypothetical protein